MSSEFRSLYCKHGNYIGGFWGVDYICGPCEDGDMDTELVDCQDDRDYQDEED